MAVKTHITEHEERILNALYRYRYLDTKHIRPLTKWQNTMAYEGLKRLRDSGLIEKLSNNHFKRDNLSAPQVYEITPAGCDYLEGKGSAPYRATWLKSAIYGQAEHNLNLCLSLCSIELACREAGLEFRPWEEIIANAPAGKVQAPWRFDLTCKLTSDAVFQIKYPTGFLTFVYELDITNHGEKEYREKFEWYNKIIFDGSLKHHLGINHQINILTATVTPVRMNNLISYLPSRNKSFFFKSTPQYGQFQKPPAPNLSILDEWQTAKGQLVSLKGDTDGRNANEGAIAPA